MFAVPFSTGQNIVLRWYISILGHMGKQTTIHQLTTMLSTSENVLFPSHNHLLTTGADDPTL